MHHTLMPCYNVFKNLGVLNLMSHALLISENQTLNNLYSVNLNAYVATNVTVKTSYKDAFKLIEINPNFDVIICLDNKKKREEISEIFNLIKSLDNIIPVIFVGTKTEMIESNFIAIPNQYSLKEIVRSVAKILQVTAKDMAGKEVPKYFPIPVSFIMDLEKCDYDVFFRTEIGSFEYEYFKIINKGQAVDSSIKKFNDEGTDFLYVESQNRLSFINATSSYVLKELSSKNTSIEDQVKILGHGFDIVGETLFENPKAAEEIKDISMACITSINNVINKIPKLSTLLNTLLNSKGEFVYIHSILGSFIASHIIDNMDWGSKEQKEKVSFVFFFHDIFLVPIFKKYPHLNKEEDLLFSDELSENEKNVVLEHASLAGELVRNFKNLPIGADVIITQHHGMTSGKGFAMQFKDDISPISKVLMIAEEVAYYLFNLQKQGKSFKENKSLIIKEVKEKFRTHTYQKMINTLEKLEV